MSEIEEIVAQCKKALEEAGAAEAVVELLRESLSKAESVSDEKWRIAGEARRRLLAQGGFGQGRSSL